MAVATFSAAGPLGACAPTTPQGPPAAEPKPAAKGQDQPPKTADSSRLPDPKLRAIHPDEVIPHFRVTTLDGSVIDSRQVLNDKPLMLVFFSSWCPICDKKLPVVTRALKTVGDKVTVVGVVLDEEDSWDEVSSFVDRNRLDYPMVRGETYLNFSVAFNPIGGVPWVVVIDKAGRVVEIQLGLSPNHYDRLVSAIETASAAPPPGG